MNQRNQMPLPRIGLIAVLILIIGAIQLEAAPKSAKHNPSPTDVEIKFIEQFETLKKELERHIISQIPAIKEEDKQAYDEARQQCVNSLTALTKAENNMGLITKAQGLVDHARYKWIGNASTQIIKARKAYWAASNDEQKSAAEQLWKKSQKVKQEGIDALKKRQKLLNEVRKREDEYKLQFEEAKNQAAQARKQIMELISGLDLDATLGHSEIDGKLAKYLVIQQTTPRKMAAYAAQSESNMQLVDQLLGDEELMVQMALAEGAHGGDHCRAMQIYKDIQAVSDHADKSHYQRLALAIALEHAKPIKQRNPEAASGAPVYVNPLQRYLHFEKADLAGQLDPGFRELSAWEYRYVVNATEPDETLQWGRDMLRNYRPDIITGSDDRWGYVDLVREEINWSSEDYKHDRDDLQLVKNILMNGGTCGRRAVLGRFMLRAHGIPTIPRPQKGHASLARWTSEGWKIALGGPWGHGWTKTSYGSDVNFLAACQARSTGQPFMRVMRAHWIGTVLGEKRCWGLVGRVEPGFWNGVALYTQRKIANSLGTDNSSESADEEPESTRTDTAAEVERGISIKDNGVILIPATATSYPTASNSKVLLMKSHDAGSQLHYRRLSAAQPFEYEVKVPASGKYFLTAKVCTPSWRQALELVVNGDHTGKIDLPHTVGDWQTTKPLAISLQKGTNVLNFTHHFDGEPKGFTIKEFTLNPIPSEQN